MGLGQSQGVVKQPFDVVCSFGDRPRSGLWNPSALCHLPSLRCTIVDIVQPPTPGPASAARHPMPALLSQLAAVTGTRQPKTVLGSIETL